MQLFHKKNECYGCGACKVTCPQNAITMEADEEGFLYPVINQKLCIDCELCKARCQIYHPLNLGNNEPTVFAAKHEDDTIRATSTSGGVFSALAEGVISNGGVVYGALYDENFTVRHSKAYTFESSARFRGSKYCQSDLNECYSQIKNDLLEGKMVLFSGTPCQVAGLKCYLGKEGDRDKLCLVEIICHGVPSPLIWKEHLALLEKKRRSRIIDYKNRSKVAGWHEHNEHVFFENGKNEYKTKLSQSYKEMFYAHLTLRPSCYTCQYAGMRRISDITIADYWGIEKCMPDFDDNKGTSLVIVNTQRGMHYFQKISTKLELRKSSIIDAFYDNHKKPAKRNINREKFWADYHKYGYEYVLKKYASYTIAGKIKRQMKIFAKKAASRLGIYSFIHQFTQKKYQGETYK